MCMMEQCIVCVVWMDGGDTGDGIVDSGGGKEVKKWKYVNVGVSEWGEWEKYR